MKTKKIAAKKPKIVEERVVVSEEQKLDGPKVSMSFDGGEVLVATANTALEALEQLKPEIIKGQCLLVLEVGGKRAEQIFYPNRLRKLLVSDALRQITIKRLTDSLK
jgi:hypothetical protein